MTKIRFDLVHFESLDDDDDLAARWLKLIGFWDEEVRFWIKDAHGNLTLDLETKLREKFNLPLTGRSLKLFEMLMEAGEKGLKLETIGHSEESWEDPETSSGKLHKLGLTRVQYDVLFLSDIGLDPRVQFLIGARVSPFE
jgi:hypothetical protein